MSKGRLARGSKFAGLFATPASREAVSVPIRNLGLRSSNHNSGTRINHLPNQCPPKSALCLDDNVVPVQVLIGSSLMPDILELSHRTSTGGMSCDLRFRSNRISPKR